MWLCNLRVFNKKYMYIANLLFEYAYKKYGETWLRKYLSPYVKIWRPMSSEATICKINPRTHKMQIKEKNDW